MLGLTALLPMALPLVKGLVDSVAMPIANGVIDTIGNIAKKGTEQIATGIKDMLSEQSKPKENSKISY